jgi:hypothetical protein
VSATVFWADGNEFATLTNTFTVNGTPTDPTVVTLTVTDPTGAVTTPSASKVTTGVYTANVASTIAGVWSYLWEGTGTASDAVAGTWTVSSPSLNKLYCTSEELKSRAAVPDTADDFEIQLAVEAASRFIDEITGRYFWRGTDTRTYVPESITRQPIDDLVSVTSLAVDRDGDGTFEETWTLNTDYVLEVSPGHYNTAARGETWPYTAAVVVTGGKLFPYTWMWSHLNRIQVTGVFGWAAVPAAVKQASLIAAADLFKLRDAPLGVVGFGEFGAVRVSANPRVMQLLRRYIRGSRVGV